MNVETDVDQTRQAWARDDPLEVVNVWWWSRSACGFQVTLSKLHHCGIGDFWTLILLAFLVQSTADLYRTWRNDWCWQDNASITLSGEIQQTFVYCCVVFIFSNIYSLSAAYVMSDVVSRCVIEYTCRNVVCVTVGETDEERGSQTWCDTYYMQSTNKERTLFFCWWFVPVMYYAFLPLLIRRRLCDRSVVPSVIL